MTRFELVREKTTTFGQNSYLEISRKRLEEADGTASEFLLITRGFFEQDGTKRWTKFVTLPDAPEVREWLAQAVREV